jgi:hypothetical protein
MAEDYSNTNTPENASNTNNPKNLIVTLRNTDRKLSRHVQSHDGDSLTIPPGATTKADSKFTWNLPACVMDVTDTASTVPQKHKTNSRPAIAPSVIQPIKPSVRRMVSPMRKMT